MKALLVLLLAAVLWAERGHSLRCYLCNSTKYSGCQTLTNCTTSEKFCTRYTGVSTSGYLIIQDCAAICPIAKTQWPQHYTFMCCQEDGCNRARDVSSHPPLLALSIFISFVHALTTWGL
ncbi:lymphocyte antigen 6E-like [Tiliqua scincoides]|uniref:lymphocyte antigen 6E-like n=1 Tax=Tiliqua scincoides TaxID=71010 RepID=UPI0034625685